MNEAPASSTNEAPASKRRFGCLHVALFVLGAMLLTAVVCFFVFKAILFPSAFKPVRLSEKENKALQVKLDHLEATVPATAPAASKTPTPSNTSPTTRPAPEANAPLRSEAYTEKGANRTIRFSEKEINALLAKNTSLADKLAINLSQDLVSAKLLVPLDQDLPVFGGKTLRVKAGMTFSYADGRPVLMLRGVTVMGVPLPNAWLGGLKNIDLLKESGGNTGFWKAFSDGVQSLQVEDGQISLTLKE